MKPPLLLFALLAACQPFKARTYHTAPVSAPSVAPVKESISDARAQVSAMRHGNDRIEFKVSKALKYFP